MNFIASGRHKPISEPLQGGFSVVRVNHGNTCTRNHILNYKMLHVVILLSIVDCACNLPGGFVVFFSQAVQKVPIFPICFYFFIRWGELFAIAENPKQVRQCDNIFSKLLFHNSIPILSQYAHVGICFTVSRNSFIAVLMASMESSRL